ncbi:Myosin-VIIa [Rhizoctonia solani]|uniref:Myosin-VIIa n=1 Tax=Rhizoctonia solani TaxID=456999 RepID=A0A0K6G337_9AGAM|nr:Myosin-VIIa [Rhizoctonia solani]
MHLGGSEVPGQESRFSRLYGLIIGVNIYKAKHRHDLRGCVSDAKSMRDYFQDIGVPSDNLLCLFDEQATRDGILDAFETHLIANSRIQRHDPIVIFFAGHGDRMAAPKSWHTSDGMVEMILPHDASYEGTGSDNPSDQGVVPRRTNTLEAAKKYVYGIPDLTLAFLLYRLSQEKGNNITVILDSCHSGSGTRGEIRSRNSHDPRAPPMPDDLDGQLRRSLTVDYPSELKQNITSKQTSGKLMAPSLETHILLAACQNDEQAQEVSGVDRESEESHGVFTTILLSVLRECNLEATSYTTLLRRLLVARSEYYRKSSQRIPQQTFQCEGRNQDRILFGVQYSTSKGKIALIPTRDNSIYRVRVGGAQGVVSGTEFGVFSDSMDPMAPPIAILVARDVGSIDSHLHSIEPNNPQKLPENAYATIIRYNDNSNGVRIWVDGAVKQTEFWRKVLSSLNSLPISWTDSRQAHDIELLSAADGVEFKGAHLIPGILATSHFLKQSMGPKRMVETLTAIVYFYFHLKHRNQDAPVRDKLEMKLWELNEKNHSWGSIIFEPTGVDLFGESVADGTVVSLYPDASANKLFGMELINNSSENLYPYLLYYDFEDYSVGCLYEPPGRTVKAPLLAGKSLAIGYGSGGSEPFQVDFTNPKSNKEYGAFVLFVFSEWVDIGYLQQESPLAPTSFDGRGERRGSQKSSVWDNIVVRVEMIRENSNH